MCLSLHIMAYRLQSRVGTTGPCLADTHQPSMVFTTAGAAGMILLDNEPNGFRVTTKGPNVVKLTLATVPQV
jgi:hypothetical protein